MIWHNFFASGFCLALFVHDLVNDDLSSFSYVVLFIAIINFIVGWVV
jgi:hypothetical protein